MCDVEKAIKGNQSDDNDDDHDAQQQQHQHQQQQQRHQQDEDEDDEEHLHLNDARDVKSTALSVASTGDASKRCLGQLLKLLFSSPGLVLLVAGYSVLGALIFPLLEAPQDLSKSAAIAKSREDCLRELWIITGEWTQMETNLQIMSKMFVCNVHKFVYFTHDLFLG